MIQCSFSNLREPTESEGLENSLEMVMIIMTDLKYLLVVAYEYSLLEL